MSAIREAIRARDLEALREYFRAGHRVLELGGSSGHQAGIIHSWGVDITSIDIEIPAGAGQYPVTLYDGKVIPYPDRTFDIVFSSNVLEHVVDLGGLLSEARRVLRHQGIMIHVLPSSTWRFWTSVARFVWLMRSCLLGYRNEEAPVPPSLGRGAPKRFRNLLRAVVEFPAHGGGVYDNALVELYFYSKFRWRRLFRSAGFEVVEVRPSRLFYTGYKTLPRLSVTVRRRLSWILGSSATVFIIRDLSTKTR